MTNLLSNAIKLTPKGGRVDVRLARVSSHVEIVVSDSGPGIPAPSLPHIFDRFRQVDSSSPRSPAWGRAQPCRRYRGEVNLGMDGEAVAGILADL